MSGQSLSRREKPHHIAVFISEFPHYSIVASALYTERNRKQRQPLGELESCAVVLWQRSRRAELRRVARSRGAPDVGFCAFPLWALCPPVS